MSKPKRDSWRDTPINPVRKNELKGGGDKDYTIPLRKEDLAPKCIKFPVIPDPNNLPNVAPQNPSHKAVDENAKTVSDSYVDIMFS